jgi:hypothetical protein
MVLELLIYNNVVIVEATAASTIDTADRQAYPAGPI